LLSHGAVPLDTGTWAWLDEYGWSPTWIPLLWTDHLARLIAHGDRDAYLAFAGAYHLIGGTRNAVQSPRHLFGMPRGHTRRATAKSAA
jgi:hypothetical protein